MPFKTGNPGRPRNEESEGRTKIECSFEEATIYITDKNKIVSKLDWQGQPIIYWTNNYEDAKEFIK